MQGLKKLSIVLLAVMLSIVSLQGHAQNIDCRSCHSLNAAPDVEDYSRIYANPSSHHPVGAKYPAGSDAKPGFNSPNGHNSGSTFFDKNGNGQPDDDEIQLFGERDAAMIECASCHRGHGDASAPANTIRNHYLRFDNTGSALCITCHNY